MAFLPWIDEYSVEITQIDQQHKHLVHLLNGLHEVLARGGQSFEISALLQDLLGYTRFHFEYEEKLMEKAGYEGLAEHRLKHRAMRAEAERLLRSTEAGDTSVAIHLTNFLKGWLSKHICITDKAYTPAMHRAGIV